MAITKLNSLAIPAGTVEPADISYPLTNFSSTGIDDNADATAITINSSENVGIGTTPSTYKLEVAGYTATDGIAVHTLPGVSSGFLGGRSDWTTGATNNDFAIATYQPNMCFFTNNHPTERMRIDSAGNIGIGTTSPAHEFHIAGTEPNIRLESGGTPSALYGLEITNGSTVDGYFRSRGATGETQIGSGRSSGWGGHLTFYTDSSERMRIDSSGRALVGKTSASITTAGNEIVSGTFQASASSTSTNLATSSGAVLNLCNTADHNGNFSNIGGYNSAGLVTSQIDFVNVSHSARTGDIVFLTHNGSSMPERMRIDSNGYVTKPSTPAFSYGAYTTYDVSGTGTQTVSTSTVWNNSSYVNLNYNNGSHFNPSNGRFTAPVAGIYRFDWRCGLADHSSGYFWWYIYKNSTAIAYWQSSQGMSSGSDDIALSSMHVYVNLAAYDYVQVKWANNYVSGTVYYPHFSGALIA